MSADKAGVTPDEVLGYEKPTEGFLCSLDANTYGIEFISFSIRDADSGRVIWSVAKDPSNTPVFPEDFDYNQLRSISYNFPIDFLHYQTVGTSLQFKVGPQEVRNFRMIERHYHGARLIKSFDFNFDFCIPNSLNTWESEYEMPAMEQKLVDELVAHPELNVSDSFYFVDGKLIMHNKAYYTYTPDGKDTAPAAASPADALIAGADADADAESDIAEPFPLES